MGVMVLAYSDVVIVKPCVIFKESRILEMQAKMKYMAYWFEDIVFRTHAFLRT